MGQNVQTEASVIARIDLDNRLLSIGIGLTITAIAVILVGSSTIWQPDQLGYGGNHYADWLVNYAGGFVRRGLAGELIHRIAGGRPAVSIINWIVFSIYAVFAFGLCALLAATTRRWAITALVLLAPGSVFAMAVGNDYYYRKEVLFHLCLVLSGLLVLAIGASVATRAKTILFYCLAGFNVLVFCAIPFVHEGFIFLSAPAHLLLLYFVGRHIGLDARKLIVALAALSIAIFLFEALYKGSAETAAAIWRSLDAVDRHLINPMKPEVPAGGIGAIGQTLGRALQTVFTIFATGYVWFWLPPMAFVAGCAALVSQISLDERRVDAVALWWYLDLYLIVTVCSLPIYLLAHDWGRWISSNFIAFVVVLLVCVQLEAAQGYRFASPSSPGLSRRILEHVQALWPRYGFVAVLLAALTVKMPECCLLGYNQTLAVMLIRLVGGGAD
jgi:hypothetical protein